MTQTESEIVQGTGSDYSAKYRFSNPEGFPLEYAIEPNRLIELQMEGSVG